MDYYSCFVGWEMKAVLWTSDLFELAPDFFLAVFVLVISVGLVSWSTPFPPQVTRMAGDPSQASDSVSLSRTQGGITENWAFSIGQFYLKMRPGQRKAGWRKTHSRQHLCLDQATPEACTLLRPARRGFCLFCHRVLTNTSLVRAGHEGA